MLVSDPFGRSLGLYWICLLIGLQFFAFRISFFFYFFFFAPFSFLYGALIILGRALNPEPEPELFIPSLLAVFQWYGLGGSWIFSADLLAFFGPADAGSLVSFYCIFLGAGT